MSAKDAIWDAAQLIHKWSGNGLAYKLYTVPRDAIDEADDELDALLLHGLDEGDVRRVEILIDVAYGRWEHNASLGNEHELSELERALDCASADTREIVNDLLARA